MTKTVVCMALALGSTAVMAQTSMTEGVTLYGIVDVGVQRVTGYSRGTDTSVVSGVMEGSRIGVRGNEDMGGGWRAIFTLENRTEANNGMVGNRPVSGSQLPDRLSDARLVVPALCPTAGCPIQAAVTAVAASIGSSVGVNTSNAFWDRQIYVGLVTPVGAVLAGRQYTPAYETVATFDVMGTQSSLAVGQVASVPSGVDIRVSNAVQYRIQYAGVTASAMYAFGGVTGNSAANRLIGGMAQYRDSRFAVGLAYNKRNNELGQESLTTTVLGGSVNVGPGALHAVAAAIKDNNPTGVSTIATTLTPSVGATAAAVVQSGFNDALKQDAQLMHVGYKMPVGAHTVYVAYSSLDDKRSANADTASYGAAFTYAFSKRTDLNFVVTRFDNRGSGQLAPGQAGFLGGFTSTAGRDSNSVAVGLRHRF